jgi:hypothetical protein
MRNELLTVKQLWNAGKLKEIRVVNDNKPPQAGYSSLQQTQILSLQPEKFRFFVITINLETLQPTFDIHVRN